jgi:biopolymer transport protein TolR
MARTATNRRRRSRLKAEINVVPYIDVMLVLLIIFMITAPLISQGVKVDLPQASAQPVPPSDTPPLIVSVDATGKLYVDFGEDRERPLEQEQFIQRVTAILQYKPNTQVLVNGDKNVTYARVVQVMALLQSAGVPSVGLMTDPPETVRKQ